MKRYLLIASLFAALVLGIWHIGLAMQAIFVFRHNEPIASWAAILLGPGSTLIAAILALFANKWGGYWLVAGGCLSLVVFIVGEKGVSVNVFPFLLTISAPMLMVGAAVIAFSSGSRGGYGHNTSSV
jgi:hypothetical protein